MAADTKTEGATGGMEADIHVCMGHRDSKAPVLLDVEAFASCMLTDPHECLQIDTQRLYKTGREYTAQLECLNDILDLQVMVKKGMKWITPAEANGADLVKASSTYAQTSSMSAPTARPSTSRLSSTPSARGSMQLHERSSSNGLHRSSSKKPAASQREREWGV